MNKKLKIIIFLAGLIFTCMFTGRVDAQIKSASITGTVKDSTGAGVPGAKITVINQATNETTVTVSGESGDYSVPYLQTGSYTITAEKTGFEPFREVGLTLGGTETARADIALVVGTQTTQVTVNAEAAQLQTESVAVSGAVNAIAIQSIPNVTQNALYYATLQPGVVGTSTMQQTQTHDSFGIGYQSHANFSSISVNGSESYGSDIQLDGVPILGAGYNEASVLPNPEGLQEVRILTNTATAEYGRGAGVITMITKNGSDQFHGSGYYRIRNEALDANSYSDNAQTPLIKRPAFKAHYYGGSIGGPIVKDKLFFFVSYEGLFHKTGAQWTLTVPTDAERTGDFSQTLIKDPATGGSTKARVFDPYTVTALGNGTYQRAEVPNANVAAYAGVSPFAQKLYSYYPEPNRAPSDIYNSNNFYTTKPEVFKKNSVNSRIDYKLNNKNSIYGSVGIFQGSISIPKPFGTTFYQSPNDGGSEHDKDKNPYGAIGDTIIVNPTTVVDVRYGVARIQTDSDTDPVGFDYASVGIPSSISSLSPEPGTAVDFQPDGTNVGGGGWSPVGHSEYSNKITRELSHSFVAGVTKSFNRVNAKAGVEYRVSLGNFADPYVSSTKLDSSTGNYSPQFVDASGNSIAADADQSQFGFGPANLLLGGGSFTTDGGSLIKPAMAAKYFALYTQNDWHPNSKLTVNLGFRWELQPGPTERHNRVSAFDGSRPNPFGGQGIVAFPGVNGYSRGIYDTHYNDVGPRVGVSYLARRDTVVRAGYGIIYVPTNTGYYNGPAFLGTLPFSAFEGQNPYGSAPNGKPVGTYDTGLTTAISSPVGGDYKNPGNYGDSGFNRTLFDRKNYKDGRAQQWNFFIEQHTPGGWLFSLGYLGSHGDQLQDAPHRINGLQTVDPGTLNTWHQQYLATGVRPDQALVANPFNPSGTIPFISRLDLSNSQVPGVIAAEPYPLFPLGYILSSLGKSDYEGLQLSASHAYANGLLVQASYTWSKSLDSASRAIANNGVSDSNAFYVGFQEDQTNPANNRKYSFSDAPQRFVTNFLYELPYGRNRHFSTDNKLLDAVAGGWNLGGVVLAQSGYPMRIETDGQYDVYGGGLDNLGGVGVNGAINQRPDRAKGVPVQLPKSQQRRYNGSETLTLASGRVIQPCANCYLKYNPDLFTGRVTTLTDGSNTVVKDVYWKGNSNIDYGDIRGPGRINMDVNVTKSFAITERQHLQVTANITNVFNHTEFTGTGYLGIQTGTTNTTNFPGATNDTGANGTAGHGLGTFDQRQIQLQARYTF